ASFSRAAPVNWQTTPRWSRNGWPSDRQSPASRPRRHYPDMNNSSDKVIISCAVTGSVHTPSMSAHLPLTPDQIATQAIEAAQAGAAILHLHARDPADGRPTADPAVFDEFVPRIRDATDAVINITTGGSTRDRKSTRLNSSHVKISYAVFCLKKKKKQPQKH